MFFKVLIQGLRDKGVRPTILFTLLILFVFRLGTHITVPGINVENLNKLGDMPFFSMMNLMSGNAMKSYSLFALGVTPYITASIIVQLLQMDIVPKFVEWSKQGDVGRRKLNQATRYFTLILSMLQSIGITAGFQAMSGSGIVNNPNVQTYIMIAVLLTTGSLVVCWLGELINAKGFGSGISMLIFAGIISSIPSSIYSIYNTYFVNVRPDQLPTSYAIVGGLIVASVLIMYLVTWFMGAIRKIPIQYTKLTQGAPASSYLPFSVNPAGVIPIIFAGALVTVPATVIQFIQHSKGSSAGWLNTLQNALNTKTWTGLVFYALLITLFSFFYAFVNINPEKLSENLQKQGGYIPSVRPGKPTEKYVSGILIRLSTVGSIFLTIVTLSPIIASNLFGLPQIISLGGTSLMIVVQVAVAASRQLEGRLNKNKYTGFMDGTVLD
ncbi:MAG: preprotein translocase subunit SecY [Streptococcaceae bacterium]|nr:preprotein translocase subunit SecY [Streptococcaceae bacterium]MCL2680950.1 preprotein translocase subunit SecY [Streptococcaceae bacterium]MCL2858263.1 preprotein translocase subunit SecY [Streptococcaceae bacterium]